VDTAIGRYDSRVHLRRFIKDLFGHWASGMTGGLSLPFALAAVLVPTLSQKELFGGLAIVCAAFAFYRVWLVGILRAEALQNELLLSRPIVVPEVVGRADPIGLSLTNVGQRPALGITIGAIQSINGTAEFDTVQILRPEDGRFTTTFRVAGGSDLRSVLFGVHLTAVLTRQREGKVGHDFTVPIVLKYMDQVGKQFEERSFGFCWIPSATGAPIDAQMLIRRIDDCT
jgi:hypothetical protein